MEDFASLFTSAEADVTFQAAVRGGRLVLTAPPDRRLVFTSAGTDRFTGAGGSEIRFVRDSIGLVVEMLYSVGRARNVRFERK